MMNADPKQDFVDVAILENIIEAQVIESILTEQNIPHRIRSYHDTAYDGLFQVQKGWGQLCAPNTYKNEILGILNDIRSQDHET
jgi:hypothetical protein